MQQLELFPVEHPRVPESWLELLDFRACESTDGWNDEKEARYQAAMADARARFKEVRRRARLAV